MSTTCEEFAAILKGQNNPAPNDVCFVIRMRTDINVDILGRKTQSPVVNLMAFSYEDVDSRGNALCLGEFVFKQREVEPFLDAISNKEITISAVHNHWLFEEPRLVYIHWEAIMEPLLFANISAHAIEVATA